MGLQQVELCWFQVSSLVDDGGIYLFELFLNIGKWNSFQVVESIVFCFGNLELKQQLNF